jgi:hypothetical protein
MKVVMADVVFEEPDTYSIIDCMNMSECFNFAGVLFDFLYYSNVYALFLI